MPIYEYRCERGHTFEVLQRMTDEPVSVCSSCDAAVERVLHPVAVHFKGSGFYTTDYGRKGGGGGASSDASKDGSGGGVDAKGDSRKKDDGAKATSSSSSD